MSYETVKSFSAKEKELIIRGTYSSSNVTDAYGRRVTDKFEKKYKDLQDFKDSLLGFVDGYFDGTLRFSNSSTFVKRVRMLQQENLIESRKDKYGLVWHYVVRNEKAYNIMVGKEKIKVPTYSIVGNQNVVLRKVKSKIRLESMRKPTVFYEKAEVERIFDLVEDWVGSYGLRIIEN
ncbi:hypothetical protein [Liquorilactobacillus mali]|uniref:Uncharacterized protein n=1 Tax=Liquorilactobacillus mali KCTC 3596 = DSM 20444 TaxID=1046596 RepID=A0A0R2E3B3_9LACO|nr:hypothetical protein [Liquorilactobacillus mali]KRN10801.1 hypothetical protein FD00_GL002043 [Liquorilactobacillus mali KCTC 3596 = DSM 20444]